MKTRLALCVFSFFALAGCSTTQRAGHALAKPDPETVFVTYRVKPGNEAELEAVLSRAWKVYCRDHLVLAEPHITIRDTEDGGKPRYAEIFAWVSRSTPEHAPESVRAIWKQEESLCERRGDHYGIEPAEVQMIAPSATTHEH